MCIPCNVRSYVPWVTVNSVPLGADYGALKSVVCAAYAGERWVQKLVLSVAVHWCLYPAVCSI